MSSKPLSEKEAAELRRLTRRAFGLLAVMTLACFGGPVGIGAVLRGGASPDWPPDRAVEWATLIGVSAGVAALMILSIALALANQRASRRTRLAHTHQETPPATTQQAPPNAS